MFDHSIKCSSRMTKAKYAIALLDNNPFFFWRWAQNVENTVTIGNSRMKIVYSCSRIIMAPISCQRSTRHSLWLVWQSLLKKFLKKATIVLLSWLLKTKCQRSALCIDRLVKRQVVCYPIQGNSTSSIKRSGSWSFNSWVCYILYNYYVKVLEPTATIRIENSNLFIRSKWFALWWTAWSNIC